MNKILKNNYKVLLIIIIVVLVLLYFYINLRKDSESYPVTSPMTEMEKYNGNLSIKYNKDFNLFNAINMSIFGNLNPYMTYEEIEEKLGEPFNITNENGDYYFSDSYEYRISNEKVIFMHAIAESEDYSQNQYDNYLNLYPNDKSIEDVLGSMLNEDILQVIKNEEINRINIKNQNDDKLSFYIFLNDDKIDHIMWWIRSDFPFEGKDYELKLDKNSIQDNVENEKIVKEFDLVLETGYKREISELELEKFIPVNYKVLVDSSKNIFNRAIKVETDKELMYILPVTYTGSLGIGQVQKDKIFLLKYNEQEDDYNIVDKFLADGELMIKDFSDIDSDGNNELFTIFSWSAGSGTHNDVFVLRINNNKFEKIENEMITFDPINYFVVKNGIITTVHFIWGSDESHFGCHHWNIFKYGYDKNNDRIFNIETIVSKNKYFIYDNIDVDDNICSKLPKRFYDFLREENIKY